MDYKNFKVPFLDNKTIKEKADNFRCKFWEDIIPINIELIIETKFSIQIIPLPGLYKMCDTDAFIASNWQSVFVDNDKYMEESYYNRLRFSIAHEIGHMVLHKQLYGDFKIEKIEDFYKFLDEIPGKEYGYIETQANKFASYFLVPRNILEKEKHNIVKDYKEISNIDPKTLNEYIATPLSKKFGVSSESMVIALNS